MHIPAPADTFRRTSPCRSGSPWGALPALLAALLTACGGPPASYPDANLLLVTLDTTRADRIGAYGYGPADTPHLDSLAHDGVLFEQAVSPVPLTLPSHTTLMTSRIPPRHGVRDNGSFRVAEGTAFLARELAASGYDTGAFVAAFVLHSRWGLGPGFDHYDDRFEYGRMDSLPGQVERRGDVVVDAALPWLRKERQGPFFAWVHLYDPHAPYEAPEPWGERFEEPYDAEIAFTDHQVGRLLGALEELGVSENTVVVVVGDHGEGLGDHGEPGHGLFVYDATQIVPLIVRLPGRDRAGTRVTGQAPMEDVAPTLMELLGLPVPAGFDGSSLVPAMDGEGGPRPAYSETMFPRFHFGWQELYALRSDGYKYVLAPREELYDLREDPGEERNLVLREPGRARRMREELEALRGDAEIQGPGAVGGEAAERLRALGYIGSAPADVGDGPLPDPKDKLPLLQDLTRGQSLVQARRPEPAVEVLRDVIARDDRIVDAHVSLGNALFQLDRYRDAAAAFRDAVELKPDYDVAISNLALAHLRLGDTERARADFEALLILDPSNPSAHYHLGEMALAEDDPRAALEHFDAGLASNDSMPALQFGRGVASLQLGDADTARTALERAAELNPAHPEVWYYLALLAERDGRPDEAAELYERQIETAPGNHRARFNLAVLLLDAGNTASAAEHLRAAVEARPDFAVGHLYLGRALLNLGELREAADAARRGLELDPPRAQRPLGHLILADVYTRQGNREAAERELRRAEQARGGPGAER